MAVEMTRRGSARLRNAAEPQPPKYNKLESAAPPTSFPQSAGAPTEPMSAGHASTEARRFPRRRALGACLALSQAGLVQIEAGLKHAGSLEYDAPP